MALNPLCTAAKHTFILKSIHTVGQNSPAFWSVVLQWLSQAVSRVSGLGATGVGGAGHIVTMWDGGKVG